MIKIYIADDDADTLRLLEIFLKNEGYNVTSFSNGDSLFELFLEEKSELVILDIMMPGSDGFSICEKIRKISNVPIILLTAKDTDADYIAGMSLGSDDYLIKPFNPARLSMKVKALLRRSDMNSEQAKDTIVCSDLIYKKKEHSMYIGEVELPLSKTEFSCLEYMINHYEEAISRETLLKEVWGYDNFVETRVTDETVRRIRKKLDKADSKLIIRNKWGYGYILEEENE